MSAHSLAPRVLGLAVGIVTAACPTVALAQTGACCFPDDICFDGVDGTDCLLVDGRFLGDGLACNGDPDGDSVFGCYDGCPLDREKDDPGVCGCGVPDDDSDADGVFDCVDLCPGTPPGMPVDESGCPPLGACCFLVGVCIDDTLPDDCFAVGGVHQGAGSTCGQECRFPGDGDVDGSGLVDLGDFWYWDPCATGPLPGPLTEGCRPLDLNGDRAVDLADFAQFQRISFTCTHDGGCGDGVVCPETEECDDGNSSNTDGCLNSCRNAWCGDGFVWTGVEACDDGAMSDTCDADCTLSMCGDGFLNSLAGEQCDDGNNVDGDGCQGNCKNPVCGDDIVDPGESCDDGPNNDSGEGFCTAHCSAVQTCGDGVPNGTESCDDGYTDACGSCNADCTGTGIGSTCGDGVVCPETEVCDDGGTDDCGPCKATCLGPGTGSVCGDGILCPDTEACDDGFTDPCGSCNIDCTGPGIGSICGDGVVCPETEVCDDGYTDACGSCNVNCTGPGIGSTCGDGVVCPETEECDDGGTDDADGCSSTCAVESGWECIGEPSVCTEICSADPDCDDGLFCNGIEICVMGRCFTLNPPCIDDEHCDEENDVCLECLSADECDDGDLCTDDACIDNDCWNIDVQCAPGVCNPDTGECVDCLVNADCQNGLFCDGDEWCSPALECQTGEDPCDDGIGCTIDICYELNDSCENAATDARCPDDELFCNGREYCNPVSDCTSTGDPCEADETCNEELDRCEVDPATWVSTQLLFPGFPGYKAPESHELDGVRDLVVAHFGLSESTLRETWPNATIEVFATDVPLGVETDMYQVVDDLGGGLTETIVQTVAVNTFHLSFRGSTATWEFDYIVVNDVDNPFGHSVTSGQFTGEQTGEITGAQGEITWTSVDATFQWCDVGVECDTPTPLDWTLGTWTKE